MLAYVRVSTDGQDEPGASPERQKALLDDFYARSGASELLPFFEVESGSRKGEVKRVEVARLLTQVRSGDVVVVVDLDRFTRDLRFAVEKVREIVEKGARFISLREGEFDGTPAGEFKLAVYAAVAQLEHARIQERTEGNRKRLRSLGKWVEGTPPYGYRLAPKVKSGERARALEIVPDAAAPVLAAFELCVQGNNLDKISSYLRQNFSGLKFDRSWVNRVLRNPVYTGKIALTPYRPDHYYKVEPSPAEWVPSHAPIVSEDLFARAQDALTLRRRTDIRAYAPSLTVDWLLRAKARCGICGTILACILRADESSGGYYVCRHRTHPHGGPRCSAAPYVRKDETERLVCAAMLARVKELVVLLGKAPPKVRAKPARDFGSEADRFKSARGRLLALVTDPDCGLSLDHVKEQLQDINLKIATLAEQARQNQTASVEDCAEGRARALAFVQSMQAGWDALEPGELRALLAALAERVTVTSMGALEYVWREPSAFVPAAEKAREAIPRAALSMIDADNAPTESTLPASRVA